MAGGRKVRGKSGEFLVSPGANTAHSSKNAYCSDRRLVPRIKEVEMVVKLHHKPIPSCFFFQYLKELGSEVVDVDDVVANLQSTYPEYSRRKKHAFRSLVGKLYQSLDRSDRQEEWLEQREREHYEKRVREANEEETSPCVL